MPLLALLCVAQLMVILDISAVNVALPDLAADLGIARADVAWTITSYSLLFGSLLLLGGRAADLLGRRRVFLFGLLVFTLSSLGSALAGDAGVLFAARAGQGLGAAMLSPAALSIIVSAFTEGRERARALGAWGGVGRGGLLATAGFGALVYAFSQTADAGWTSAQTLVTGVAGIAVLAAFAALELRTAQPLLRVQRLAERAVGGGALMMLAVSAVMFGTFLLTSLYMQEVLGAGALETGLAFLPTAAAIAGGAHAGSHVVRRSGVRLPMAGGLAVTAAGMLLLAGVDEGGSYLADVLPGMLIAGVGLGVAVVCVAVAVLTGAREGETGMLSGLNTTGHEVGGSLGDAYLAAAAIAAAASLAALAILPSARSFLPRLELAPSMPLH